MKSPLQFSLVLVYSVLATIGLTAQPRVSYMIPDIGTTRFATYIEIVAPTNAKGSFGPDVMSLNNANDNVRVVCDRPSDTLKVKIGPVVVSWDGRLISTHIFVSPLVRPNSADWQLLNPEFRIPIRVVVGGVLSNIDTFYIVKPWPLGNVSTISERVLGEGQLGKRSKRGAMIVDSLYMPAGQSYAVSIKDCDLLAPGNQGLLPYTLISPRTILGIGTVEIHVDGVGRDGGPGGGGGAGGYDNLNVAGNRGSSGGNGYTGGGPGGFNNNGLPLPPNEKQRPGTGSGEDLPKSNNNTRGSASLNGVRGGESTTAYENAGGGTGHPFGESGQGCDQKNTCVTIGQYGAGSGAREGRRGGGGGFGEAGGSENGFDHGGKIHGNSFLVPLSGGSGGAGGNPDLAFRASGGGGGGGAISIHAELAANITVYAKGSVPSREDILGGCGSGGGVIVGTRLDNAVVGFVGGQVSGGNDPNPDPTSRLLPGGRGRTRYDARVPNVVSYYVGPLTDTMSNSFRQGLYSGHANGQDLQVFIKPENGNWQLGPTIAGYQAGNSGSWRQLITWPGQDTLFYVVVGQRVSNPITGTYTAEPNYIFSQSAWNIVRIYGPALISAKKNLDMGLYVCPGSMLTNTVWVYNKGESPLSITSASFIGPGGFALTGPTVFPDTILPFDSTAYVVQYQPLIGQTGVLNTVLRLVNSDTSAGANPFDIAVRVDVRPYEFRYSWRGIQSDTLDIGRICAGRPFTDPITIRNVGLSTVMIERLVSTNSAIIETRPILPTLISGPVGFAAVNVTFVAKGLGVNVTPVLVYIRECMEPDTMWIKHEGVESSMTLVGTGQFGLVRVGNQSQLSFVVVNSGTSDLSIASLPPVGAPFRLISAVPPPPTILAPGAAMALTYEYAPASVGQSNQLLKIVSDSTLTSCAATVELLLAGSANTSVISLSQSSFSFGVVSACDSLVDSVVIRNVGGAQITLLYPGLLNGPDALSYKIIRQPIANVVLNTNDSAIYVIGLYGIPGLDGLKSAILSVRTSDQSIRQIDIPISGFRKSSSLDGPRIVDLGVVNIGSSSIATRRYTNSSANATNVVSVVSSSVPRTSAAPATFNVGASGFQDITFTYVCVATGAVEDTVRFIIDQPCPDTMMVLVRAVGTSPSISAATLVDFGIVAQCAFVRDSIVYANRQAIPLDLIDIVLSGRYARAFSIENLGAVSSQTLAPGEQRTLYLRFDPRAMTDGVKSATITLRVRIGGAPVLVSTQLVGERRTVLPSSPVFVAFGSVSLSVTSTQRLVLVNNGSQPVRITNVSMRGAVASVFSVASNPQTPATILAGGSIELLVGFTPTAQQEYFDSVLITFDQPCSDTRVVAVSGTGRLNVEVRVRLPKDTVSPTTEDYRIPIYATVVNGSTSVVNSKLTMTVRYASSVFAARTLTNGSILRNTAAGGFTELDLEVVSVNVGANETVIGEIVGDMTLGSVVSTDLVISNASLTTTNVTPSVSTEDGSLTLEICEEGGPRLIKLAGALTIVARPNPASEHVEVVADIYERGEHRIDVVTLLGNVVASATWMRGSDNTPYIFDVDTRGLSSGTYQIILQTPTRRRVLPLSIFH